jgi:hypothetical protein
MASSACFRTCGPGGAGRARGDGCHARSQRGGARAARAWRAIARARLCGACGCAAHLVVVRQAPREQRVQVHRGFGAWRGQYMRLAARRAAWRGRWTAAVPADPPARSRPLAPAASGGDQRDCRARRRRKKGCRGAAVPRKPWLRPRESGVIRCSKQAARKRSRQPAAAPATNNSTAAPELPSAQPSPPSRSLPAGHRPQVTQCLAPPPIAARPPPTAHALAPSRPIGPSPAASSAARAAAPHPPHRPRPQRARPHEQRHPTRPRRRS